MFRSYVRFSQFADSLNIASNILARRLDSLVASGLMETRKIGPRADHHEYHLTEKGVDMKPVIMALTVWGDRWLGPGPIAFHHGKDGGAGALETRCFKCGETVSATDVIVKRRQ